MSGSKARQLQLVRVFTDTDGKERYELGQEAVEFLNKKRNLLGVHISGGVYRSGKSFFNNRVMLQSRNGPFGVGETVQAHTMGLWIATKTIPWKSLDGTDYEILCVDMEGLSAIKASESHDVQLLALGLLLSSCFTLNAKNSINEATLVELAKVIEVTKCIHLRPGQEGVSTAEELAPYLPQFLFLLRDFSLTLADEAGSPITAKQYLEQALAHNGSESKESEKNQMRSMLRKLFTTRDCVTLSHPGVEQCKVNRLNSISNRELPASFVAEMEEVRRKICDWTPIKRTATGEPINGPMFVQFVQSLVDAFNRGDCPVIQNAWAMISDQQCRNAYETAIGSWAQLQQEVRNQPQSDATLSDMIADTRNRCMVIFDKMASGDRGVEFRLKLSDGLDVEEKRLRDHNLNLIKDTIRKQLQGGGGGDRSFGESDSWAAVQTHIRQLQQKCDDDFGDSPDIRGTLASVLLDQHVGTWVQQIYHAAKLRAADLQAASERGEAELRELRTHRQDAEQRLKEVQAELVLAQTAHAEVAGKHEQASEDLSKSKQDAGDLAESLKKQEHRANQAEAELLKAIEEAGERVAAAEKAKAEAQLRVEDAEEAGQQRTVQLEGVREELGTSKQRIAELEEEAQQVYDLTQLLSETKGRAESAKAQAAREKQEFERRVQELQAGADQLVDKHRRQWEKRYQQAERECRQAQEQAAAADKDMQAQAEQGKRLAQVRDDLERQVVLAKESGEKCQQALDAARTESGASIRRLEGEKSEERERRLRELSEVRQQWEAKVRDAEQAKMDAMQATLAEKMENTRHIKDVESQLAIAQTQLSDRKRARESENAPSEMEKRKKMRLELDEKVGELSRVIGERTALSKALERQASEVARIRAQLVDEQKQRSEEQHHMRMEMLRIKINPSSSSTAAASSGCGKSSLKFEV